MHQTLVYSDYYSTRIQRVLDAAGRLRMGAAIGSGYALVLKGLVDTLTDPRSGQPYRSAYLSTGASHVVLAPFLNDELVLLDPSVGVVPFDRACRRLATVDMLCRTPALLDRIAVVQRQHYLKPRNHRILHFEPSEL